MILSDESKRALKNMLKQEEGFRQFPYQDTNGHLTIGYGRNLETVGVSEPEASFSLDNDIEFHLQELNNNLSFFAYLDEPRKIVLADMSFNLGFKNLMTFERMLKALSVKAYDVAADEMVDSIWHKQVGHRADALIKIMRTGQL